MQLTSAPTVLLEAAAATATASSSPIGMLLMIFFWPALAGLIVFLIIRGKRKRAAALKPVAKPQAAPKAAPSSACENIDAIEKLAELHRQGILTDEEFSQKKKTLLDKL